MVHLCLICMFEADKHNTEHFPLRHKGCLPLRTGKNEQHLTLDTEWSRTNLSFEYLNILGSIEFNERLCVSWKALNHQRPTQCVCVCVTSKRTRNKWTPKRAGPLDISMGLWAVQMVVDNDYLNHKLFFHSASIDSIYIYREGMMVSINRSNRIRWDDRLIGTGMGTVDASNMSEHFILRCANVWVKWTLTHSGTPPHLLPIPWNEMKTPGWTWKNIPLEKKRCAPKCETPYHIKHEMSEPNVRASIRRAPQSTLFVRHVGTDWTKYIAITPTVWVSSINGIHFR